MNRSTWKSSATNFSCDNCGHSLTEHEDQCYCPQPNTESKTHPLNLRWESASKGISDYLQLGGLFNPEMMDADKVRDLILQCRDELAANDKQIEDLQVEITNIGMGGKYADMQKQIEGLREALLKAQQEADHNKRMWEGQINRTKLAEQMTTESKQEITIYLEDEAFQLEHGAHCCDVRAKLHPHRAEYMLFRQSRHTHGDDEQVTSLMKVFDGDRFYAVPPATK